MDYGSSSRVEALEPKAGVLEGLPGGGTSRVESEGWDTQLQSWRGIQGHSQPETHHLGKRQLFLQRPWRGNTPCLTDAVMGWGQMRTAQNAQRTLCLYRDMGGMR